MKVTRKDSKSEQKSVLKLEQRLVVVSVALKDG